jgi:hypothetical protein
MLLLPTLKRRPPAAAMEMESADTLSACNAHPWLTYLGSTGSEGGRRCPVGGCRWSCRRSPGTTGSTRPCPSGPPGERMIMDHAFMDHQFGNQSVGNTNITLRKMAFVLELACKSALFSSQTRPALELRSKSPGHRCHKHAHMQWDPLIIYPWQNKRLQQ